MRQTFLNHLLCHRLMVGRQALDHGHRARQHSDVALQYSLHEFGGRRLRFATATLHVGIDNRGLAHA